jgi:biopolymer transport protein TolR
MAMSTGGAGGRAPLSEINVTPLVDVMLVLLIIFMVAAPMMTAGIQVNLPNADAPPVEQQDEELLMLSIDAEQKVFLGETEVPLERLQEVLSTNARLQEKKELFVQADASVPYGYVVRIFTMIRSAGVESIGLVTDPAGVDPDPGVPPTAPAH